MPIKRSDIYLILLAVSVTVIVSAHVVADGFRKSQPYASEVGRWTIQQSLSDGWNVFDTQTGKICTIPSGSGAQKIPVCSSAP